jgi:tetratricopeptide (TPR) repeat protein
MVSRRLAVHRALADALCLPGDADRQAWHLAAATTEPDERVAAELERTAAKAVARSGYAAATTVYERAVALSADPAAQARRLTLAAKAAAEIGEFDRARSLAVRAAAQTTDPALLARLAGVHAMAESAQGGLPAAHRLLVEGAAELGGQDPLEAARMLMDALHIAWFLGDAALIADTADRLQVAGGSVAQPYVPLVQLTLWSVAQAIELPIDGLPPLADLVAAARRSRAGDPDDLALIASVSLVTGRNADGRELMMALTADARAQGRIGWLPTLLTCLAQALVFDGRHGDALATANEALGIAHDTGQRQWAIEANAILAYLAAVDGDQERCRWLVDAALVEPATHATTAGTPWAAWALGLLELGRGRLDTALVHLEAISQGPMRYHASALRSVPDLIEVAVHLGQPQRVAEPLARFSRWARHANTPSTDALVERSHALVGTEGDPERHYLAALKLHDRSFQQARTQLLYGAWLRRVRRKADARTQLRAAVDYLDRINASPWAERARAELNATGLATPRPGRVGLSQLTPRSCRSHGWPHRGSPTAISPPSCS